MAVGLADRIRGHLRRPALREADGGALLLELALLRVGPAPLDHQSGEDGIGGQSVVRLVQEPLLERGGVVAETLLELLLHRGEVRREVVHSHGAGKIGVVATGEELGHVPEVGQAVVDRRRREEEHLLLTRGLVEQIEEPPVPRPAVLHEIIVVSSKALLAGPSRVPEVVGLVDHHSIGQLREPLEPGREVTAAVEVGVAEHGQVAEVR